MPVECQLGCFAGADGSCSLAEDGQRSVVVFQGPCTISHENEKLYRHVGNINLQATSLQQQDSVRPGGALLLRLLEQCVDRDAYPRTEMIVHADVQDVHNAGVDARLFNAASLCLLDAAVRMRFFFAAVSVAHVRDPATGKTEALLNPPPAQLTNADSVFVYVFKPAPSNPQLVGSCASGSFTFEESESALELARTGALSALDFVRAMISRKLNKSL